MEVWESGNQANRKGLISPFLNPVLFQDYFLRNLPGPLTELYKIRSLTEPGKVQAPVINPDRIKRKRFGKEKFSRYIKNRNFNRGARFAFTPDVHRSLGAGVWENGYHTGEVFSGPNTR